MAKTSRDDVEILIRRAGLSLSITQVGQIHKAWGLVEPMLKRIRNHDRDRVAEPAPIFLAEAYMQRSGPTENP